MRERGEVQASALFLRTRARPRTCPLSPELRHAGTSPSPGFFRPVAGRDTPGPDATARKFFSRISRRVHL